MADQGPVPHRLDSWKAIADYLRRDVGTVRRWEKALGLPVRRVPGGRGRSVFAYASEVDEWLKREPSASAAPTSTPAPRRARRIWIAAAILFIAAIGLAWRERTIRVTVMDLHVETNANAIVAFDTKGDERWRYALPSAYNTAFVSEPVRVMAAPHPAIYVASSHRVRRSDGLTESGALTWFDPEGRLQKSFSFADEVAFHGTKYGPPWGMTSFATDDSGGGRIAVAAHHFVWDASLVTVLDDNWRRKGTFVHDGWIEDVRWLAPDRLLVSGFSNAHDGGMVALLDPAALDGQGPEMPGSKSYCDACGSARPLRMIIMPRTEVNRASVSPFNRVRVQVMPDRIIARTLEVPSAGLESVDALYEFTPSLELIRASFSDRYWEVRLALEEQGKVSRPRDQSPEKDGPLEIEVWDPQTGWRTQKIH
jgi:hypothetical protein